MAERAGPSYFYLDFGTPTERVIKPSDQMNDATFKITRSVLELKNQSSAQTIRTIQTGFMASFEITLVDTEDLNILALAFNGKVITDPNDSSKKAVEVQDNAGAASPIISCLMKPGVVGGPSEDPTSWIWMPFAELRNDTENSISYGVENQRMFSLTINLTPNPSTGLRSLRLGHLDLQS